MKKILLPVAVSLLLVTFSGCKKYYPFNEEQEILFQLEYVNYAWGYQHFGYIIDGEGNVLTYSNPENWNFSDDDHIIAADRLAANLSMCRKSGIVIDHEELKKYASYIDNISSSKLTASRNTGADAGSTEFLCYQYSPASNTYKGYLIKMEGDFSRENLNFYSKKVVAWMKEINEKITSL